MENFKRESNGYATHEVDEFLQKMRKEYNEKLRRQNEKMFAMNQEMNDLKYSLEVYKEKERQISKALIKAVQKADEISNSARTVYDLEIKRVQLLYKKWENVLNELRTKFAGLLPGEELDNLVGDFQYALTVTLNSQLNEKGERIYSKSVLERMQHRSPIVNGKYDPSITLKENEIKVYYDSEGNRLQSITRHKENNEEVTLAEKYLNGEDVKMPDSYGEVNPNLSQIPPVEFTRALQEQQQSGGFNLQEALHPQESLKEILKAFNLDDEDYEILSKDKVD